MKEKRHKRIKYKWIKCEGGIFRLNYYDGNMVRYYVPPKNTLRTRLVLEDDVFAETKEELL